MIHNINKLKKQNGNKNKETYKLIPILIDCLKCYYSTAEFRKIENRLQRH